jgi:hypothetical protein
MCQIGHPSPLRTCSEQTTGVARTYSECGVLRN